jgi:hypothetical protein
MSSKSAGIPANLLEELQNALSHGPVARRVETLQRITDLFIQAEVDYSDEQIGLFEDVFHCLIEPSGPDPQCSSAPDPHACVRRSDRGRGPGTCAVGPAG